MIIYNTNIMSSSLSSILSLCSQRKKQQLFNVPPSRIETVSPYTNSNITKFKLDMRRKAEVLKHDQGNTKTNGLTKKQLFTQVINGKSSPVSKSYVTAKTVISTAVSQVLDCDNKNLPITTPSSASGVPNDYISNINTLYCDPTIPLYNYINPILTRSYGIINTQLATSPIRYSKNTDVNSSSIATLEFTDAITNNFYTVSLSNIPLAIQITGDISGVVNYTDTLDSIVINSIVLNSYYNTSLLKPNSIYTYSLDPSNTYKVDVSNNELSGNTFSQTIFIGNISISNILLYSTPGYIYDFYLVFNVAYSQSYDKLKNINVSIIENVTTTYLLNHSPAHNCNISFSNKSPDINKFGDFIITAS